MPCLKPFGFPFSPIPLNPPAARRQAFWSPNHIPFPTYACFGLTLSQVLGIINLLLCLLSSHCHRLNLFQGLIQIPALWSNLCGYHSPTLQPTPAFFLSSIKLSRTCVLLYSWFWNQCLSIALISQTFKLPWCPARIRCVFVLSLEFDWVGRLGSFDLRPIGVREDLGLGIWS